MCIMHFEATRDAHFYALAVLDTLPIEQRTVFTTSEMGGSFSRSSRRFPTGTLTRERDALVIEALVHVSKVELARWHGRSFLARYPESALADCMCKIADVT